MRSLAYIRLGRLALRLIRRDPSDPRIDAIFAEMDRLQSKK